MSAKIKRYKLFAGMDAVAIAFLPDVVVAASDYDALAAECDRLKVMSDNYCALLMDANAELARLRGDAERYRLFAATVVAECNGVEMTPAQAATFGALNSVTHVLTVADLNALFDNAMAKEPRHD